MVQFNLIPSIKKEFLRVLLLKKIVFTITIIVTGLSFLVFVTLFIYVMFFQNNKLAKIDQVVQSKSATLIGNSNLNKILTIQNQLQTLPSIESKPPVVSRLFNFINQLTPTTVTISSINLDFGQQTVAISGAANNLQTVNQFIDTLKFTDYIDANNIKSNQKKPAFSNIVLSSFSYNSSATNTSPASYSINFSFDPTIFNSTSSIKLYVPNLVTTRSILGQPSTSAVNNLFKKNNNLVSGSSIN